MFFAAFFIGLYLGGLAFYASFSWRTLIAEVFAVAPLCRTATRELSVLAIEAAMPATTEHAEEILFLRARDAPAFLVQRRRHVAENTGGGSVYQSMNWGTVIPLK